VRASHAANNGRIFAWDNPPETGHPGEDYGCRCTAEAYTVRSNEYAEEMVTSIVDEGLNRWEWYDFVIHYYFGNGQDVRLSNVGHLKEVIRHTKKVLFEDFCKQLADKAREASDHQFTYETENGYDFMDIGYIYRVSKVETFFNGAKTLLDDKLNVIGEIKYIFTDEFTDPLSIRQAITTYVPINIFDVIKKISEISNYSTDELIKLYKNSEKYTNDDIVNWIKDLSEAGGTRYKISDEWVTNFEGTFYKDRTKSRYVWNE
jgi:hypothetical protein